MNKVFLIGRLTKDPELRFTPGSGTAVTTLTLAVDKYNAATKQREADFIPVVVWGKQAESVANYMNKGSQMAVGGRIQTRSYEAKDGTKRYVTEVVANEVEFLGKSSHSGQATDNFGGHSAGYDSAPSSSFGGGHGEEDMTPVDDGDIPF
ncbi:MAG: single-stranded DNA-binding protein [Inconstantimicrobium porci]|uniref:Single-stranded DNA-binding protein n=1 Tax=Inconstantimicrobium porci TaxID=2652291 RepID=A0A7X2MYZ9_9CLOT|nr:single-stranded DNA-binding protein [Inconstantimicrobium porci]MDY5912667.1 single-stranded DNA-binding protein [Inconstantimicrobium porci]MSR91660.1 single-stranded DNA-binding protein [Inconstantimicrobium porci]